MTASHVDSELEVPPAFSGEPFIEFLPLSLSVQRQFTAEIQKGTTPEGDESFHLYYLTSSDTKYDGVNAVLT